MLILTPGILDFMIRSRVKIFYSLISQNIFYSLMSQIYFNLIVVTHFWVPIKNRNKKPKEVRKITGGRSAQKMVGKLVKEVKNTKI